MIRSQGNKGNITTREMVMEHDVVLDEAALLPFLQSILKQAGFIQQTPVVNGFHNFVTEGQEEEDNVQVYNLLLPEDTSTAVFKAISDCRRLRHSIREIKPVLSFLIHGGHREAKLLAKKFSTKLPLKRCRAILTIYCLPPSYINGRAPRTKRFKSFMQK